MDGIRTNAPVQGIQATQSAPRGQGVGDFLQGVGDKVFGSKTEVPAGPLPLPTPPPNTKTPEYVSDPTLDHNAQQCNPRLSEQRLVPPCGKWDGAHILNSQSQLETGEPSFVNNQESRCGPSSTLGAAVMAGPGATARLTERVAAGATDKRMQQYLGEIRNRIIDGTATRQDLSRLQEEMYRQNNGYEQVTGEKGLDFNDVTDMQSLLGDRTRFDPVSPKEQVDPIFGPRYTPSQGHTKEGPGRTGERISHLGKGESFTLHVDTTGTNKDVNHFVQVGKDGSGRAYVYDPYPRANQANVIYQDENPDAFKHYTGGSMGIGYTDNAGRARKANVVAGGTVSFDTP